MLLKLKIQNLVLVEKAEIHFGPQLNIITGETGSGKSAILSAIRLIGGARAEIEMVRKDCETAIIEAEIVTPKDTLWVRRELYRSGKSRCFIDDAQVSLASLKDLMENSLELVDQNSAHILSLEEEQRSILDTFVSLSEKINLFKKLFEEEKLCRERLKEFSSQDTIQANEWAQKDLDLIEKINWQKDEDLQLNQEHTLLTHAQELKEKAGNSSLALQEIPPALKKLSSILDAAARLDPTLEKIITPIKSAGIELEEAARSLESYADRIEADPARLTAVEMRIGSIENLKRRFGSSWDLVQKKKEELQKEIEKFSSKDQEILFLQKKIQELSANNLTLAEEISQLRKKGASLLEIEVTQELKNLNLPHAQFQIAIQTKSLSSSGLDQIQFLFSANPGLAPLPIDACASGGELSRLLLAIKISLAEKENRSCLIFDEIDSNVGGQTASVLGEELKKLAKDTQVICVTHFVQVAKCAQTHFGVYKQEQQGRAITIIEALSSQKREKEYTRMLGLTKG